MPLCQGLPWLSVNFWELSAWHVSNPRLSSRPHPQNHITFSWSLPLFFTRAISHLARWWLYKQLVKNASFFFFFLFSLILPFLILLSSSLNLKILLLFLFIIILMFLLFLTQLVICGMINPHKKKTRKLYWQWSYNSDFLTQSPFNSEFHWPHYTTWTVLLHLENIFTISTVDLQGPYKHHIFKD